MSDAARFWDRIAERYAKRPVADEGAYQEKLRITQSYLRPDMAVLEFGCGTGSTALLHAPFVKHVRAMDISPRMIEIAKRKADAARIANVTFECKAVEELDAPAESFDAVLGLSILHLLDDWRGTISKARQMLKPGGVFVTSTMCLGDSMKFLRLIAPIGKLFGLLPTLSFFTTSELEESLRSAGFDIAHEWQPGKNRAVFIVARKSSQLWQADRSCDDT